MAKKAITNTVRIIEALIFASAAPVPRRHLEKHLPEGVVLDDVLAAIAARYGEDSGIELRSVDNAWAFRTKAEIASLLMIEKQVERTLSRAALETLAIIAYHQPATRAEIEAIRGVSISGGTMDILLEQGWIKPGGRRHTPGRPLTWKTTDAFLDHFSLDDITALPGLEELKQAGLLRSKTTLSDQNGLAAIFAANEDEDSADDDSADDDSAGDDSADGDSADGDSADDDSPDDDSADDDSADEDSADEDSADEDSADDKYDEEESPDAET